MSARDNKEFIRKMFADTANHVKYLAPGYVWHNPIGGGDLNVEQGMKFLAGLMAAFPDYKFTVKDQVAEGDKVVSIVTEQATHKGTFNGIPATGKKFMIDDVHIHRIAKGKIAEVWTYPDMYSMMTQLGVIPAPKK